MIKANELRINNWVSFDGNYVQVSDISSDGSIGIHNGEIVIDVYSPIPLTPEILEQCGALRVGDWWCFKVHFQSLCISLVEETTTTGNEEESVITHIRYLHQLQNVIYSLRGEELTLQPIKELSKTVSAP